MPCVNFQFSGIYCYSHVFRDNLALKEWINLSNRGSWVCAYRLQLVPPFQQSLLLELKKGKKKKMIGEFLGCRTLEVRHTNFFFTDPFYSCDSLQSSCENRDYSLSSIYGFSLIYSLFSFMFKHVFCFPLLQLWS